MPQILLLVLLLLEPSSPPIDATHEVPPYTISGWGTHYDCTAGWCDGTPTVALPLALGGRYNGRAHGVVTVCATRCADLLVVDYCQCYWGTSDQRVVDLNDAAWWLVTDQPPGKIKVTVYSETTEESVAPNVIHNLPNTSMKR